jgi:O-antigen/teichoic acid export membrane protein
LKWKNDAVSVDILEHESHGIESNRAFSVRLARNSVFYFSSQIAGKGLFFLITVYLARTLGAVEYGKFAFAYGFVTLFSVITKFGLDLLTSRDVGENPQLASKYLHASLSLRTLLSIFFLLMMLAVIQVLHKPADINHVILLLAMSAALHSIAGAGTSLLEALQAFSYRSVLNVLMYGFSFVILVSGASGKGTLDFAGVAFVVGAALYCAVSILLSHVKVARIKFSLDSEFLWRLFKMALPLGLMEIFIGIYYRIDTVLLSFFTTDAVVGWYDAAYTFVYGLRLLPVTVAMVLLPGLTNIYSKNREKAAGIYRTTMYYSIATGVWITFLIAANSSFLVSLVFGSGYDPSSNVLAFLIWTCAIMFANAFQGILLVVTEQRLAFLRATLIGALSNLILNLILIPRWNMHGAATATVLSELFVFFACAIPLRGFITFRLFGRFILPPAAGAIVMYFLWSYLSFVHFVVASIACTVVYIGVLLALKGAAGSALRSIES